MIAQLTGILRDKAAPVLLLDVNGVGYEVQASLNTFAVLPALGNTLTLLTHFVVREDAQQLFGFASREERQLFRTLIKISGVGPKLEVVLNELGFWHFDQIAKWSAAEIAWVDSRLKFKGRIERDGWIAQAKAFASEG